MVGDLIGSGDTQERNMVGDTPNLAARLLALAEPNSIVIADETRLMLGDFFDFEDLGLRHVKGIEHPVRSWMVMSPRAVESRFEALHSAALTEFSGRDDELALLSKRWIKAKGGEGQAVLISGEPGIGKSRLTAALMGEIANEPHTRLRYFCSPQHTDSAFYPVIHHMERMAGFGHGDGTAAKLDKLDAMLKENSATEHDRSLIAALLSLPADRYAPLDYDAAQRRAKTMEALIAQVVSLAARGPVLQILEDAHWIDPTSLETFGRMVEKLKGLSVLLVITYRPEFNAPWVGESHVTTINLNRLGGRDASRIVASLAGNKSISADVIADIVDRSDGIPLFLEEMIKAVLEAESEDDARRVIKAVPSQKSSVPASLHSSLMARLDRLGAAKGIAQVGAAIGRTFSHALLAAVARESEAELAPLLDRLVASGLLFRQGQPPDATYLFKHALIRDAAYSMLLREPRRALHARILEALETKFADVSESQPELLAHHATEAGEIEKAAGHWGNAGERSSSKSAVMEARIQLTRAQKLIATLASTPHLRDKQIKLQGVLARAVSNTSGYASSETKAAFEAIADFVAHANSHGDTLTESFPTFASFWGLWAVYLVAYDQKLEQPLAARCYEFAQKHGDTFQKMIAHNVMGQSQFFAGKYAQAKVHLDSSLELYSVEHHRPMLVHSTEDIRVMSLIYSAWTLNALGFPNSADLDIEEALKDAREIGHISTLMYALHGAAWNEIKWTRDTTVAKGFIDELAALAEKQGAAYWKATALCQRGITMAMTGNPKDAIPIQTAGIAAWRATGATVALPLLCSHLAHAHARIGEFDEAWRLVNEAMTIVSSTNENTYKVFVLLNAGEVKLMSPEPGVAKAEALFRRALAASREQEAKGWELRAALSLARLWRDQGKPREAYELLSPVYSWFTEGFDWTDMKQARALLEELRSALN